MVPHIVNIDLAEVKDQKDADVYAHVKRCLNHPLYAHCSETQVVEPHFNRLSLFHLFEIHKQYMKNARGRWV